MLNRNRSILPSYAGELLRTLLILVALLYGSALVSSEVQIAVGQNHTLVLAPDGRVWSFGKDNRGQLGDDTTIGNKSSGVLVGSLTDIIAVAAGRAHSLALRADGTVWSWGDNTFDQLGHNSGVTFKTTPVQIPGLSTVISIAAGGDHSLAVNVYGDVFAWGSDTDGELGNGAPVGKQVTPANVLAVGGAGNLARAIAVAAGNTHSMALLADGTVVAWGRDVEGQLGNGAVVGNQIVPVVVTGLADVTAIACGWQHSLARLADGTVRAWGRNDVGQLGTLAGVNQPFAVNPGSTQVKAVSAGENHSVFQFVDGSLAACGNDFQGAVGNNSTPGNVAVPTAVALGGAATRTFAAGGNHTVACLADGSFQAWGSNSDGQLGFGSLIADQQTPVAVLVTWPMVAITHVDAANSHSVALKSDGTVWAWGANGSGQLGINNTNPQYSPVQVLGLGGAGTLSGIIAISSGSY